MREIILLAIIYLFWSCSAVPAPSGNKFACGMAIKDIASITHSSPRVYWSMDDIDIYGTTGRYGSYLFYVHEAEGLHYIANSQAWGIKETRLSPLRNLCNGKLAFIVDISWDIPLIGSAILVDGVHATNAEAGLRIILSEGEHEIQIVKKGFLPLTKKVVFTAQDRGDHRVKFISGDLIPEN